MPRKLSQSRSLRTPKYRRHKATGQAYVQLNRKRFYLGNYDLPRTREKYHRLIAEWEASGRQPMTSWNADGPRRPSVPSDLLVAELVKRWWDLTQWSTPLPVKIPIRPVTARKAMTDRPGDCSSPIKRYLRPGRCGDAVGLAASILRTRLCPPRQPNRRR